MSELSRQRNLNHFVKDIEAVFDAHGFEDADVAIAFRLPGDAQVRWVTNTSRPQTVDLLAEATRESLSKTH